MNEWLHVDGCSVGVEIEDVEDFELLHEWFGVCLWGFVVNESYDFLVCSVEWLHVCLVRDVCSPDGDRVDEMWVDV